MFDSNKLAYKLLNEIKYNKRYQYNWVEWSRETKDMPRSEEKNFNLIEILANRIDFVFKKITKNNNMDNKLSLEYIAMPLLKKIKEIPEQDNECGNIVISFDNDEKVDEERLRFNYFFHCDLNTLVLSAIWTQTVGKLIEEVLGNDVHANRLSDKNAIFKPYFEGYSHFRNKNFEAMKRHIEENQTGVYIQTDLEQCFYNVNINSLKEKVEKIIGDNKIYRQINSEVFSIISSYHTKLNNKTSKYQKNIGVLPIGFLPSNILINLYLSKFDREIFSEFHPIEYGRYVDDIGFLINVKVENSNKESLIEKLKVRLEKLLNEFQYSGISLNKEKTLFFVITKNSDVNYLKKFEKTLRELSSDNFRLIDTIAYEEELAKSYIIGESPTKITELFNIHRDKKHLSRIISTIYYSSFGSFEDIREYQELAKHFIESVYNLIDDEFFLELYDYWYQLITIELIYKGDVKTFENYEKTQTFNKMLVLKKEYKLKSTQMFIKQYLNLIEECSRDNSILISIQNYFRLPHFKLEFAEQFYLNYEQQLSKIWKWFKKEEVQITELFNNGSGGSVTNNGSSDSKFNSPFLRDYPNKNQVTIAQANMHTYGDRHINFMKYSKNISTYSDFTKIFNDAIFNDADIVVFPEQGLTFENLPFIARQAARNKIAIVGGLDFILKNQYVLNLTIGIIPQEFVSPSPSDHSENIYNDAIIYIAPKKYPAPLEYDSFHNSTELEEDHLKREIYIPEVQNYKNISFKYLGKTHAILNCYEATDLKTKYALSIDEPVLIHMITNNKDVNYFEKIAVNLSRELMSATTITNYSEFGGTMVYVPFSKSYKRIVSSHKGSDNTHADITKLNLTDILHKRRNNLNRDFKQNPPKYYYRNLGWGLTDDDDVLLV